MIQISKAQAEIITTGYAHIKIAAEALRPLRSDPDIPTSLMPHIIGWIDDLDILQGKMDRKMPDALRDAANRKLQSKQKEENY